MQDADAEETMMRLKRVQMKKGYDTDQIHSDQENKSKSSMVKLLCFMSW